MGRSYASHHAAGQGATPRLVAVIGCQRSGTTLIGQILGAHRRAVLFDENDGLYAWLASRGAHAPDRAVGAAPWAHLARKYREPSGRFQTVGGEVALSPGVCAIILKAPNLTFGWRDFAGRHSGARFIAPIRDPRAVAASMLRLTGVAMIENQTRFILASPKGRAAPEAVEILTDERSPAVLKAAAIWRVKTELCEPEHGTPYRVRYEDLVDRPGVVCAAIAEAAGLDPDGLSAHDEVMTGYGNGGTARNRPVDAASRGLWRTVLSDKEAEAVLEIAGPLAVRYGYLQERSS